MHILAPRGARTVKATGPRFGGHIKYIAINLGTEYRRNISIARRDIDCQTW